MAGTAWTVSTCGDNEGTSMGYKKGSKTALDQHIGVRIPGGQPNSFQSLTVDFVSCRLPRCAVKCAVNPGPSAQSPAPGADTSSPSSHRRGPCSPSPLSGCRWTAEDRSRNHGGHNSCLLYTSDAADEEDRVDLGGR